MRDFALCPSCRKPVWEDQPEYCGWHQWCAEQASSTSAAMQNLMAQQFNQPYTDAQIANMLNAAYSQFIGQWPWNNPFLEGDK